jgi:hypothetical protein
MYETVSGPQLRDWCQKVGLLLEGQDFADKRARGEPISVRAARTFILNYYAGRAVEPKKFDQTKTVPNIAKTGGDVPEWTQLRKEHPQLWSDAKLVEAGKEFGLLAIAQRDCFLREKGKGPVNVDYAEKALNYAVLSAWAYVAGMLHANKVRLDRHYGLRKQKGRDPLNADTLAKGRHKSDPENYRGLGYRTDPKERGRFVEVFYEQTEKGEGITKKLIDLAIAKYHAKQAMLEVKEVESRL